MENSPKALLDKLKQDAEKYITEAQRSFFEYIWAINLNDCLISHDGQQPEFIKYVKKSLAERAFANLLEFTEGSDHPVSTAQLEEEHQKSGIDVTFGSVRNLILQSNDIFPTKHGKYGMFKHINFDKNDQNKILSVTLVSFFANTHRPRYCRLENLLRIAVTSNILRSAVSVPSNLFKISRV